MAITVYDTEIFSNLFLVCFYEPERDSYRDFRYTRAGNDVRELTSYIEQASVLVSFNGLGFDNLLLKHFLKTGDVPSTKELANGIIGRSIYRKPTRLGIGDEIDICLVLDRKASLKTFQARLQMEKICEWEGDFIKPIPEEAIPSLVEYCHYDCLTTWRLYQEPYVQGKIEVKRALGAKYGVEWNDTESGLSEKILEKEIKVKLGLPERSRVKDIRTPQTKTTGQALLSPKIKFKGKYLTAVLKATKEFVFEYIPKGGKNFLARAFVQRLEIPKPDGSTFACNLGVGGLHSVEGHGAIVEPKDGLLVNYDVSSYYPSVIDLLSIAPSGIEKAFLGSYRPMIVERLKAKGAGEKIAADSLKIVLNSAFGRFKYPGSCLYNPVSMLAVTLNCQFFYLMLIEQFLLAGIEILQVNTDGILVYPKTDQIGACEKIVAWWQKLTRHTLDNDRLDGVLIKDVNTYAWIKKGKVVKEKGKGFRSGGKRFDVDCGFPLISGVSVQEYFLRGTPIKKTVMAAIERKNWSLFAVWSSRKEGKEGRRRLRRYVYAKRAVDKIQGVACKVALLEDASTMDWGNVDAKKYIADAEGVIRACRGGEDADPPLFDFEQVEPLKPMFTVEPFSGIPKELRNLAQWVLWKLETVAGREKPAKIPYTVTGVKASTTSAAHWSTFEACVSTWQAGGYSGLGFVFADNGIVGIDLDGVIDEFGKVEPGAQEWVDHFASYTERSQSGKGLHILVRGKIPGIRNRVGNIEVYESARYFVMTGNVIDGHGQIREGQTKLDAFYQTVFPDREPSNTQSEGQPSPGMSDEQIIRKASNAKNAGKFKGLYITGDISPYAGDDSSADFALCSLLAFYTQDAGQMDRIFRRSALYHRPGRAQKWDSRRGAKTYGERSIRKALEGCSETYQPSTVDRVAMRRKIEAIQPEAEPNENTWEQATLAEYEERVKGIAESQILLVSGATGAGKTWRALKGLVAKGTPTTVWSPFIHAAQRAIGILKTLTSGDDLGLIIAAYMTRDEDAGLEKENVSMIGKCAYPFLSTTFGYLGRKGHKGQTYSIVKELVAGRVHLVDEPQRLWDAMQVSYTLAKRFWTQTDTCQGIGTCLLHSKRGTCATCCLAYKLKAPIGRGQTRNFYREFPNEQSVIDSQTKKRDLGVLRWDEIEDISGYAHLAGTSFYKLLTDVSKYEIPADAGKSEPEYLTHLLKTLKYPQLRHQHPTKNGLAVEASEGVLIPQYPCEPILMGVDFLPLLQLLSGESVIFTSATLPPGLVSLVEEIAQATGKQVERLVIKDRPAKFKMAVLKIPEKEQGPGLSLEAQAKILGHLHKHRSEKEPVRTFVVTARRSEAHSLFALSQQELPDHAKLYDQRNYEALVELSGKEENSGRYLITYGRSAIGCNVDMPDRQLVIVSAKQFLPMMAVLVKPGTTEEQARLEIARNAWFQIDQIIGRLLRTKQRNIAPGQIYYDQRQIVVVLHSLPDVLGNYRPNQESLYEYREYTPEKDGFLPLTGAGMVEAVVDAIEVVLAGQVPQNRREQDREALQAKAEQQKSVGIGALSKAQRIATARSREQAKEATALAKWQENVKTAGQMLRDGTSRREITRKFNLARLSKADQTAFWGQVRS